MEGKRPAGPLVLGIVILLWGIACLAAALMLFKVMVTPDSQISINILKNMNPEAVHDTFWAKSMSTLGVSFVYLLLSTVMIVASIGIIRFRDWGRLLLLVFVMLDTANGVADQIIINKSILAEWPFYAFSLLSVAYLFLPKVKKRFK